MNLWEKAINDTMNRMRMGQGVSFLETISEVNPADVRLRIGCYFDGGILVMSATVNGKYLGDTPICGLLCVSERCKQRYLTAEWRQKIKSILNQHKAEVKAAM